MFTMPTVLLLVAYSLFAGAFVALVLRKPLRRMRVKRLVRKDQEAAGPRVPTAFPDGAPVEVQEAEPVTMETLEKRIRHGQWDSEKNLADKLIAEEVGALAMAKLLLRIQPAGGIKDGVGSIKKDIRQHVGRIDILKQLRYDIEHSPDQEPLPMPSDLEVVRQSLPSVMDGADSG